ncbi:DUF2478 domain-containing protein [Polycladidibacter stylochi]|uniref:DUF2478 domain-containing protein n=1 Tax=Polycladidibacter stylochi TaxID=1807766 RepID=UPI000829F4CE|nr:DUF2478 domain-containing protein [Pseudovibrio stylochi]
MSETPHLPIAAIGFNETQWVDPVLEAVAIHVQAMGGRVVGVLQSEVETEGCCGDMYLRSLSSKYTSMISQSLGSGSRGCRLDPHALAEVNMELMRELAKGADLVIVNRFGKGESEGRGLRNVIEAALEAEIPVLCGLKDTYKEDFKDYVGDMATILDMNNDGACAWAEGVIPARRLLQAM